MQKSVNYLYIKRKYKKFTDLQTGVKLYAILLNIQDILHYFAYIYKDMYF